jgi:hypothetical protein
MHLSCYKKVFFFLSRSLNVLRLKVHYFELVKFFTNDEPKVKSSLLTESTRNASVMIASLSDVRKMSQECVLKCRLLNGKHRVTTFSTLGQIKIDIFCFRF